MTRELNDCPDAPTENLSIEDAVLTLIGERELANLILGEQVEWAHLDFAARVALTCRGAEQISLR